MKECVVCHLVKDDDQFSRKSKGRTQSHCKLCQNVYSKAHYRRNRQAYYTRNKIYRQASTFAKTIGQHKATHPCTDCGVCYPPYVMDYDHVLGDKRGNVSSLVGSGRSAQARNEILKCELVCSNCHRIRTHNRKYLPVAQS